MASSSIHVITAAAAVTFLLLTAPHMTSAITCSDVTSAVAPCSSYAYSGKGSPSASCCSGVRSLNSQAATGDDRRTVCNCLKNLAKAVSFNAGAVAGLPGKCGVNVPFVISTTTDCSKVH
ncbi:Non-specific lipid-transfer protein [Rhynchospora pubera]|uniref:Non-specific lipid-transfer protein n=1 Tax=Rhynchospora pubera TaxID=906938 RepID=A0AAV8BYX6_9POAL|nr:Non-specific lipid-transfer protein [Rhynchospora pubera]